jgi:hypothetical protein
LFSPLLEPALTFDPPARMSNTSDSEYESALMDHGHVDSVSLENFAPPVPRHLNVGLAGVPFTFVLSDLTWSCENHRRFPSSFRHVVVACLRNREENSAKVFLPADVLVRHVLPWCPRHWFRNEVDAKSEQDVVDDMESTAPPTSEHASISLSPATVPASPPRMPDTPSASSQDVGSLSLEALETLALTPSTYSLEHSPRLAPKPSKRTSSSPTGDQGVVFPEPDTADDIEATITDQRSASHGVGHQERDVDAHVAEIDSSLDNELVASTSNDASSEPDWQGVTDEDPNELVEIFADGNRHVIGGGNDPDDAPASAILFFPFGSERRNW